jgi:DNA-binding MarR family transcriptional regulator
MPDKSERQDFGADLRRLQAMFSRFYAKVLTSKKLTIPQFSLLIQVADAGPLTMTDLSERLYLTLPSITNLVDRLEEQKLVVRAADAGDRRVSRVKATARGEQAVREIRRVTVDRIASQLEDFSEGEMKVIRKYQGIMLKTVAEQLDLIKAEFDGKRKHAKASRSS